MAPHACLYRESCSGRIAAIFRNKSNHFPSRCLKVVFNDVFRSDSSLEKLEAALAVYDGYCNEDERTSSTTERMCALQNLRRRVEQVIGRTSVITYFYLQDPVWFLLRPFRFSSRTEHGFLAVLSRDFDHRIVDSLFCYRGKPSE